MMHRRAWLGVIGVLALITINSIVNFKIARLTNPVRIKPHYQPALEDIGVQDPLLKKKNKYSGTCDQETRLGRLQEACPAVSKQMEPGEIETLMSHLLVDEKLKLIYCYVPKAGSSTWKRLLVNISGYDTNNIDKMPIHGDNIQRFGIKFLSQYDNSEAMNILNDTRYLKFLAVRHPLDRLISAYKDKFIKTYSYGGEYSRWIARHYHPEKNTSSNATLLEFVQYLSEHYDIIRNEHWLKYTELCQPCAIKYDLVLKLETVDNDTQALYNKISEVRPNMDLGLVRPPPVLNPTSTNKSSSLRILKELADLPDKVMFNLYNVYKSDFELFGYSWDKMKHIAKCKDMNKQCC